MVRKDCNVKPGPEGNALMKCKFIKKGVTINSNALILINANHYFLCLGSLDTVSLCLPLALRRASTFLPFAEAILSINPCLFLLFLFDG